MGMKRYKISAINSYASYKQNKRKMFITFLISLVGIGIIFSTFLLGSLKKDMSSFLYANGISLFDFNRGEPSENVYLPEGKACYSYYITPMESKGIYIPCKKLGQLDDYIELAKQTQINCFVIDVKDDYGYLTFKTDSEILNEAGCIKKQPPIENIDEVITRLNEAGIYTVARVVAFKDNVYSMRYPDSAVKNTLGETYVTSSGDRWLDPYDKGNWEYILEICEEARRHGFKEIQFDYVRFHESMNEKTVILKSGQPKIDIITEFVRYMSEILHRENVKVSADVFGAVVLSDLDASIVGQDFVAMSKYLDYISPMVYPSHYAEGTFGIDYPHLNAYQMILKTMELGEKKLAQGGGNMAKIRPWLQDFTLSKEPYLLYGPKEIKEQIQGANDAGVMDWLFWNSAGNYTKEGLIAE